MYIVFFFKIRAIRKIDIKSAFIFSLGLPRGAKLESLIRLEISVKISSLQYHKLTDLLPEMLIKFEKLQTIIGFTGQSFTFYGIILQTI